MEPEVIFSMMYADRETPNAHERWQLHFFKREGEGCYCREPVGTRFYPTREKIEEHARTLCLRHGMAKCVIQAF